MTTFTEISIEPHTGILKAIANQPLTWQLALGEFIDNAAEAGARLIELGFGRLKNGIPQWFSVQDDGIGCQDLKALVTLGDHRPHPGPGLSRYGIGAKDAMLWIGHVESEVVLETFYNGKFAELKVNWAAIDRAQKWKLLQRAPVEKLGHGTRIKVAPCVRRMFDKDVKKQLSYTYAPLLKSGAKLIINRDGHNPEALTGWRLPPLQDGFVDTQIVVLGKRARVYVGIVRQGETNDRPGITYSHRFRVIEKASGSGCGDYNIGKIAGFVDLSEDWTLTKNKDGISLHSQELYEAVEETCRHLLAAAHQQHRLLESTAFEEKITARFNDALFSDANVAKARRGKGNKEGTIPPVGDGPPHRRAAKHQPGTRFPGRKSAGFKIEAINIADDKRVGYCDVSGRIVLNTQCEYVASIWASQNESLVAQLVCSILANEHAHPRGENRPLPGFRDDGDQPADRFAAALRYLFERELYLDGARAIIADQNRAA